MEDYNTPGSDASIQDLIGELFFDEQEYKRQLQTYELIEAQEDPDAWIGAQLINGQLVKKDCPHLECPQGRCEKYLRLEGIEL